MEVSMPGKKSILLRISPDLSEALARWADDELRSVNGQIEYILREAVRRRTGRAPAAADDAIGKSGESGAKDARG